MKAEKVHNICAELLPELLQEKEELEELIEKSLNNRKLALDTSFATFQDGLNSNNTDSLINGLIGINSVFKQKLQFVTFKEFDSFMKSSETLKL